MKVNLLILGLMISITLQAQKSGVKLYGYSQAISKGTRNTTVNENGETKMGKKSQSRSILIYLEIPSASKPDIKELWINGDRYRFEVVPENAPVLLHTGLSMPGQKEAVLIPETKNAIIRIVPFEKIASSEKDKRKIAKQKALVVFYTLNTKSGYRSLEKLEILPDMVNE